VGCENRMWLPNGSRSAQSMPYGRSVGSSVNSTPFARSSSYVLRQASVAKNRCPPARPFVTSSRTWAAVLSASLGWPGRSCGLARFSETARSRPGHREAIRDRRQALAFALAEVAGRFADDLAEGPAERAEAGEPDIETDLGHIAVGPPEQVHGALDAAALEVAV